MTTSKKGLDPWGGPSILASTEIFLMVGGYKLVDQAVSGSNYVYHKEY